MILLFIEIFVLVCLTFVGGLVFGTALYKFAPYPAKPDHQEVDELWAEEQGEED